MNKNIPLTLQTAYADLLDRCSRDSFAEDFSEDGTFTAKTIRGRRYWYFQIPAENNGTRKQRYVGAETLELLEQIKRHKEARGEKKDRQSLVSTLVRAASLPRPSPEIGNVVVALASAAVFRLGAVLVGTVAYQTYAGLLGVKLSAAALQTGDIDIAQSKTISLAAEETAPSIMAALRNVDSSFREVPGIRNPLAVTSYVGKAGIRVDFLTPNEGPDTDAPAPLAALGTDAQQLRFLDFLINEPEGAVVLHGEGIYVLVPSPQRYALHKLIVARRRKEGAIKATKDIVQAEALLSALMHRRPHELRMAWEEAFKRGKRWRQLLGEGLGLIAPEMRDLTLKTVAATRSVIPGLDLEFSASAGHYDSDRDIVAFLGQAGGETIRCAISREAIEDHFNGDGEDAAGRVRIFREKRSAFEKMARTKYLKWPIEESGKVLIKTSDVARLIKPAP